MNHTQLAIDLAKNKFQLCLVNEQMCVLQNKPVSRSALLDKVRQLNPKVISMEACYSANHWGRTFKEMGIEVQLIPAQHVSAFVRGNKNDKNDALAIIEASRRPNMRFVPVKNIDQQTMQSLLRVRERTVAARTSIANQIRGILSEYGITINQGIRAVKIILPNLIEDQNDKLPNPIKTVLATVYEEFQLMTSCIQLYEKQIKQLLKNSDIAQRLLEIPGFGTIATAAFLSSVGNGAAFKNGREVSAWAGITPRQYASGDKSVLAGITKRGNRYLRTALTHGARSIVRCAKLKDTPLNFWIRQLLERRGHNKTVVAVANKMARIAWAVANKDEQYNPTLAAQ